MAKMAELAPFRISLKPVWRDMDALAHVNNAVYATWLETAREAWWTEAVGPFDTFPFLLARLEIDFLRAVTWRNVLEVTLWVSRIGTTSFDLAYAIVDEEGRRVANAKTVQVMYDHAARRTVPIDATLRRRLQDFVPPDASGAGLPLR